VLRAINFMSEELQNREEQIIQSKKLASIGILTAGVAHELGNPLNNISMIAQNYIDLYDKLSREDRLEFMKMIEEETERITDIVRNLLDFSKPKKENLKKTDINSVLHKSLKLVQNMSHISNIDIQMNLQEEIPPIFMDENRILEVIVNLITNAIHATPPGGRLTIETQLKEEEKQVEIRVVDTGKGIPADILPNLFDPFFSTKGTSGTGLGLFVSYGIVKNHGGTISVSSEVGTGTTFTITLPIHNKKYAGGSNGSISGPA
nr:ATP-binding protein [Desulfobacteraceae bacterium]